MKIHILIFTVLFKFSLCRDFYVGMFKKNDLLVAQDTLYKEKNSFGFTVAKYGRMFNCPITFIRVSDRLGFGRAPNVRINRGGLQKKYLTLIITSSYNTPIAVNIYIGCENKGISTTLKAKATTTAADDGIETTAATDAAEGETPADNEAGPKEEKAGDEPQAEGAEKAEGEATEANGEAPATEANQDAPAAEPEGQPAEEAKEPAA